MSTVTTMIPVDWVESSDLNPNILDEGRFALLVAGIKSNGFLQPILVRPRPGGRYQVADGHHRLQVARELGMVEVPAVVKEMSDDQHAALQLAMNKLRGEIDLSRASTIVADLASRWQVEDLAITGFTSDEVASLLAMSAPDDTDGMAGIPPDVEMGDPMDDTATAKIFDLTLVFEKREDYVTAKRRLKKAAGRGGDLAVGLMKLLGETQPKEKA